METLYGCEHSTYDERHRCIECGATSRTEESPAATERGVITIVCLHPDCPDGRHAFFLDPVGRVEETAPLSAAPPRLWMAATCRHCGQEIRRAAGDIAHIWRTVIDGETVGNVCAIASDGDHVPVDAPELFDTVGL